MERKLSIILGLVDFFLDIKEKVDKEKYDLIENENYVELFQNNSSAIRIEWDEEQIHLSLNSKWSNRNLPSTTNYVIHSEKSNPYYYTITFNNVDDFGYFFVEKVM